MEFRQLLKLLRKSYILSFIIRSANSGQKLIWRWLSKFSINTRASTDLLLEKV